MTLYENLSHDELIGKTAKVVMSDGKWRIVIIEKAEYDEYKDRNIIIGNCIKTNDLDHTSLGGVWAYIDQAPLQPQHGLRKKDLSAKHAPAHFQWNACAVFSPLVYQ